MADQYGDDGDAHCRVRPLDGAEATSLGEVLDRLAHAHQEAAQVSVGALLEAAGRRSFGALLLVPGLLVLSPLSGIPGVPTMSGLMVLLITVQLLFGRTQFWLPDWLLRRRIRYAHLARALKFLRPVARFADRLLRPRWGWLAHHRGVYVVALVCAFIGVIMPPMELVPFLSTLAGAALSLFGMALIGRDGLAAFLGLGFCLACMAVFARTILL